MGEEAQVDQHAMAAGREVPTGQKTKNSVRWGAEPGPEVGFSMLSKECYK